MKAWLGLFALACACGGNGTSAGARGDCAEGGQLAAGTCPVEATPDGACMYLVECGAIPIESDPGNKHAFDYGDCVDAIEGDLDVGEELVIDCIEHSSCDSLKVPGSPDAPDVSQLACFHLGGK